MKQTKVTLKVHNMLLKYYYALVLGSVTKEDQGFLMSYFCNSRGAKLKAGKIKRIGGAVCFQRPHFLQHSYAKNAKMIIERP